MTKVLKAVVAVVTVCSVSALATPMDYDFSGTFIQDNDMVLLDFTVSNTSLVTVFSSSWVDGGFDPILAIWDNSGNLVYEQDDGSNVGSTISNGVTYDHGRWDSYYQVNLDPGIYTASIAQYNNFANGTTFSEGFRYDDSPNFTSAFGSAPYFNGVMNSTDYRSGQWAFHLLNVDYATQQDVPEPAMISMFLVGMTCLAAIRRKK